jgi:hypothetical protein
MVITLGEAEGAALTWAAAFFGYIASGGFVLSQAVGTAAGVTGAIAALAFLGYNAYAGNVAPAPAAPAS